MGHTVITVDKLSKRYRLGELHRQTHSFRDRLTRLFKADGNLKKTEIVWALKDISLAVKEGEILGIIGPNGAGKSTLLKILSRITKPTSGNAWINGRTGSLLEVGTGFHPELTGRENIYLNGAILGMKKAEINHKFDEIVAFAETEKFIDTPVKRYSSGMYVRLAFAVAAHLEPEILLVDEVLAVGDANFQRKCLGRLKDVSGEGRTVMMVSHNMSSIVTLCDTAVWIDKGRIRQIDDAAKTVQSYLASGLSGESGSVVFEESENTKEAYISAIKLTNSNNEITSDFEIFSQIKINIAFLCKRRFSNLRIEVVVSRYDGVTILSTTTQDYDSIKGSFEPGTHTVQLSIPGQFLASGEYFLGVGMSEMGVKSHDVREFVLQFRVQGNPFRVPRRQGFLVYPFEWKLIQQDDQY